MNLQIMALWAIHFLSSSEGEPNQQQIDNIYKISHVALGECDADHADWIELTKRVFAEGALHGYCPPTKKQRQAMDRTLEKLHLKGN